MVSRPLPDNRVDCTAWQESGAKAAVGNTTTIAEGGYPGTGLLMPHRRRKGEGLPERSQAHNKFHKQLRARVCPRRMNEAAHTALRLVRVDSRIIAGRASRRTVCSGFAQMTWLSGEFTAVTKRVTACEKASGSSR